MVSFIISKMGQTNNGSSDYTFTTGVTNNLGNQMTVRFDVDPFDTGVTFMDVQIISMVSMYVSYWYWNHCRLSISQFSLNNKKVLTKWQR